MKTVKVVPTDRRHWLALRAPNLNSTEVSTLFDLNPYETLMQLFDRKAEERSDEIEETERMRWGTRLQDSIARGIAAERGWKVRKLNAYMTLEGYRLGASFDFERTQVEGRKAPAIFEIKNVDSLAFKRAWETDDDGAILEAPPHIEMQVQAQMLVSGRAQTILGVLVGGNQVHVGFRTFDPDIGRAILTRVREFWASVAAGARPNPNWARDARYLLSRMPGAEAGSVLDARDDAALADLAGRYVALGADIDRLTDERTAVKARLMDAIGANEKAILSGYSVSAKTVGEKAISYTRKSYRDFRVTKKEAVQ